mmetsp:Transcript_7763/g.26189  ORF Transcript_7763/g.26189 Transcript_7763/m.26189 type:complete len:94 (-) Transcript_7763:601-882(-)
MSLYLLLQLHQEAGGEEGKIYDCFVPFDTFFFPYSMIWRTTMKQSTAEMTKEARRISWSASSLMVVKTLITDPARFRPHVMMLRFSTFLVRKF